MFAKVALLLVALCAVSQAAPGGWGGSHKHVVIHVPYKVHTIHHHHVEKIPIVKEVPIIKEVPIVKEVHVPIYKEIHVPVYKEIHHSKGWDSEPSGWY